MRARVSMEVVEAFYGVLAAEAVLKTTRADLENRQLLLRQVSALADERTEIDARCELCRGRRLGGRAGRDRAESGVEEARAQLSAALGDSEVRPYELMDEPLPPAVDADAQTSHRASARHAPRCRRRPAAARCRREGRERRAGAELPRRERNARRRGHSDT